MEVDECLVEKWKALITSLNSFMEFLKLIIKPKIEKLKGEPKKVSVESATDLEN